MSKFIRRDIPGIRLVVSLRILTRMCAARVVCIVVIVAFPHLFLFPRFFDFGAENVRSAKLDKINVHFSKATELFAEFPKQTHFFPLLSQN